jgi:hypothetical protein
MLILSEILSQPIYLIGLVALILIFGLFLAFRQRQYPYYACETLLTPAELKFYKVLKMAVPAHHAIMMKVRMGDIITCNERDWHRGWGPRISAKHIDFVIIDAQTTRILCGIELDDSSHRTDAYRIERDKFVNKAFEVANVPLHRIPVQKWYDAEALKNLIIQQP